jgi:hypothetical protein
MPVYEQAKELSPEDVAYLKKGRWWPPKSADMINKMPPSIVIRALRPGLFDSE